MEQHLVLPLAGVEVEPTVGLFSTRIPVRKAWNFSTPLVGSQAAACQQAGAVNGVSSEILELAQIK
jgi:hypothetical protein